MKRILAAIDFSDVTDAVVQTASELTQALGGTLVLLHVATPPKDWGAYPGEGVVFLAGATPRAAEQELLRREEALRLLQARLQRQNIEAESRVAQGYTAEELLREVDRLHPDLIVVGSHRHGTLHHLFLGGTRERVVRNAPCPVVVVHARPAPTTS